MKILFCTSKLPGAALIRAVTWSDYSHVAIIDGDEAIEAVWPCVRVSPLADVIASHPEHVIADFPCLSPIDAIKAARSQVGKPYDLAGILGIGLHRDWQETDSWFCSELVAWAFVQGGTPLFRPEAMHRITPQHLWILSPI